MKSLARDYSGTWLRSTRPISVYAGHECAKVNILLNIIINWLCLLMPFMAVQAYAIDR